MEDALIIPLGTSYAPGHNFWPGSRASWYVRGAFAFLFATWPAIISGWLMVRRCRSKVRIARWPWLMLTLAFSFGWLLLIGIDNVRDGDKPFFIGFWCGVRSVPIIVLTSAIWAISLPVPNSLREREFEVRTRD